MLRHAMGKYVTVPVFYYIASSVDGSGNSGKYILATQLYM